MGVKMLYVCDTCGDEIPETLPFKLVGAQAGGTDYCCMTCLRDGWEELTPKQKEVVILWTTPEGLKLIMALYDTTW